MRHPIQRLRVEDNPRSPPLSHPTFFPDRDASRGPSEMDAPRAPCIQLGPGVVVENDNTSIHQSSLSSHETKTSAHRP
jgi:hypothetical protein